MLYELAWVYVRLGDVQRAERALEVLSIADPNSQYIADGTLLRADLLLRAGRVRQERSSSTERARAIRSDARRRSKSFLGSTKDVAVYYDKLAQQQLDSLDQNSSSSRRWRSAGRARRKTVPLAFAVIDDVNECKKLIKRLQSARREADSR